MQRTATAVTHTFLVRRPTRQGHRRRGSVPRYPVIDAQHAEIGGAALRVSHDSPSRDQPGAAGGGVPRGRRSRRTSQTVGAESTYIENRNSNIGGGLAATNASDSGTITK